MHKLTDAEPTDAVTVLRLRELIGSHSIRSALERSSDTVLTFAFRAIERVLSDRSRPHRETINLLWNVLDEPHLNQALGLPPTSRMTFGQTAWETAARCATRDAWTTLAKRCEPFDFPDVTGKEK
jgi:hypothetical protein